MEVEFSQVAFLKVFLLPTGTDQLARSPEPQFLYVGPAFRHRGVWRTLTLKPRPYLVFVCGFLDMDGL